MSKLNKLFLSGLLAYISITSVHAMSPEECFENSLEEMRQYLIAEGKEPTIRWDIAQAFELECGLEDSYEINAFPENYMPSPEEQGFAPTPAPAEQDPILRYAENLADHLEGRYHSACKILGQNLRNTAYSQRYLDPAVRMRLIESSFNSAPSICF